MRDYKWYDNDSETSCLTALVAFIIGLLIALFLCPFIELLIWNEVFIPKFNAPELTFWDMFLINAFISLINPVSNYVRRN